MRKMNELYDACIKGEPLIDNEVIALRNQFKKIVNVLSPMGPRFSLACKEAAHQRSYLTDICIERGIEPQE